MGDLITFLYELEDLLDKYAMALERRMDYNGSEIEGIMNDVKARLGIVQKSIDLRISHINKKLVLLNDRLLKIDEAGKREEE